MVKTEYETKYEYGYDIEVPIEVLLCDKCEKEQDELWELENGMVCCTDCLVEMADALFVSANLEDKKFLARSKSRDIDEITSDWEELTDTEKCQIYGGALIDPFMYLYNRMW